MQATLNFRSIIILIINYRLVRIYPSGKHSWKKRNLFIIIFIGRATGTSNLKHSRQHLKLKQARMRLNLGTIDKTPVPLLLINM